MQGLRYHLSSSHDLFNFEFWVGKLRPEESPINDFFIIILMDYSNENASTILQVTEEYQAVNVSVKTDIWRSEVKALLLHL